MENSACVFSFIHSLSLKNQQACVVCVCECCWALSLSSLLSQWRAHKAFFYYQSLTIFFFYYERLLLYYVPREKKRRTHSQHSFFIHSFIFQVCEGKRRTVFRESNWLSEPRETIPPKKREKMGEKKKRLEQARHTDPFLHASSFSFPYNKIFGMGVKRAWDAFRRKKCQKLAHTSFWLVYFLKGNFLGDLHH